MALNEWLSGAEKACNDAIEDPTQADRLLRFAQVHALIAIAQEIGAIRELILLTEEEVADGIG